MGGPGGLAEDWRMIRSPPSSVPPPSLPASSLLLSQSPIIIGLCPRPDALPSKISDISQSTWVFSLDPSAPGAQIRSASMQLLKSDYG